MSMDDVARRGLVLLGCGKMGSALLDGWLKGGLPAASVWVIDPAPSDWLQGTGFILTQTCLRILPWRWLPSSRR